MNALLTCSMENSLPAISATLEMTSMCLSSPISRHLENVRVGLGWTTIPKSSDNCCQCLEKVTVSSTALKVTDEPASIEQKYIHRKSLRSDGYATIGTFYEKCTNKE